MARKDFAKKLNGLSKSALKELLLAAGLKQREERVLVFWYIDEFTIYQIAETEKLTKESAYNVLCMARSKLFNILNTQSELLDNGVQNTITYLLNDYPAIVK